MYLFVFCLAVFMQKYNFIIIIIIIWKMLSYYETWLKSVKKLRSY